MPKGKYIEPTTKRTYTLEKLQELRSQADLAGDTDSRDKLSAKIVERGGVVPTGEIPEDETKLGRFERLRRDALEVGDTDSAEKLAVIIAEINRLTEIRNLAAADGREEIAQTADGRIGKILGGGFDLKDEHIPDYVPELVEPDAPHAPHEGKDLVGDHCTREIDQVNKPEPGSTEWMARYPFAACEATPGGCARSKGDPLCDDCNNGDNYISPPLNGGMNVHTADDGPPDAPQSDEEQKTLCDLSTVIGRNLVDKMKEAHQKTKFKAPAVVPSSLDQGVHIDPVTGREEPSAAPEDDEARLEGPEATEPVNNGTASISAVNTIKAKGYVLAEIPAKDGEKVTIHDIRRYERLLTNG